MANQKPNINVFLDCFLCVFFYFVGYLSMDFCLRMLYRMVVSFTKNLGPLPFHNLLQNDGNNQNDGSMNIPDYNMK